MFCSYTDHISRENNLSLKISNFVCRKSADQLFLNALIDVEQRPNLNPTTFEAERKSIVKEFVVGIQ